MLNKDTSLILFCSGTETEAQKAYDAIIALEMEFHSVDVIAPAHFDLPSSSNEQIAEDFFSIFTTLKNTFKSVTGKHTLFIPSHYILTETFLKNLSYKKDLQFFESSNHPDWWLRILKRENPSDLLSAPVVMPVLLFETKKKLSIDASLHFLSIWDLLIKESQKENVCLHVPYPEGLLFQGSITPLLGYYDYLSVTNPDARKRLPFATDEWVAMQQTAFEQVVSKNLDFFASQVSSLFPKMNATYTSLRQEYKKRITTVKKKTVGFSKINAKKLFPDLLLKSSKFNSALDKQPMRLLFITRHCPFDEITGPIAAGAELSMRRIAEHLAQLGHEVHYLALPDVTSGDYEINGVKVHLVPYNEAIGTEKTAMHQALKVSQKLFSKRNSLSKSRLYIDKFVGKSENYHWKYRRVVDSICKQNNIQLIHCFSSSPDSLASAITSHKFNIPLVVRMGGRFWYLRYKSFTCPVQQQKYLEKINYAFQATDCLAFNSEFIRKESYRLFKKLSIPYNSAEAIIDIGVEPVFDESDSSITNALNRKDQEIILCCVGKFKKFSKRQDLLIESLAELPNFVKVAFAGDGPEMEKMEALAKATHVSDRVIFLGSISQPDVYRLLEESDVFIHPSEFEGSSKAVAEAMILGKPVIASNIPPNAEHVIHGENGLLAENTVDSFVEQITKLVADPELRDTLSNAAMAYSESNFKPKKNALRYEALFRELIRNGKIASESKKRKTG